MDSALPQVSIEKRDDGGENGSDSVRLSPKQVAVLAAILAGASLAGAAKAASLHPETVRRWRREDGPFRDALAAGIRAIHVHVNARIVGLVDRALDSLVDVLEEAPDSRSRVLAAQTILQLAGDRLRPRDADVQHAYLQNPKVEPLMAFDVNAAREHWLIPAEEEGEAGK